MAFSPAPRWLRQGAALAILIGLAAAGASVLGAARLPRADFVLNNATEIQSLDPHTVTGIPEGRVMRAIYEGLTVKHPETLAALPGMAESWEVSDDGLHYRFHMRAGAVWSDGEPIDARDFAFAWCRLLSPETAAEYAYQLWCVEGAEAWTLLPDDRMYRVADGTWWQEIAPGRYRVGFSAFSTNRHGQPLHRESATPPPSDPRFPNNPSTHSVGDWMFAKWLPYGVLAPFRAEGAPGPAVANELPPDSRGEVRSGMYDEHWVFEVEPTAEELATLRLLSAAEFRDFAWRREVGIQASEDGTTLDVTLRQPTPYFLDLCAFYPLFPVSEKAIERAKERWPSSWRIEWLKPEHLVTNGPYRVAFRRVNDRIRLEKSPSYWDADHIAFDTIDLLAVDHLGTSLNLYLTGEVDWIDRPIAGVIPRLLPREDFNPAPYLGTYFYRVNITQPPFDDVRVRRALALSIDRRAVCEKITKSGERPSYSIVPRSLDGYVGGEMRHSTSEATYEANFAKDLEEAQRLLVEAGYGPDGAEFPTFEILYNTDQTHKDIAEVLADGWSKQLGIDAKTLNQEWKVYLDSQRSLDYQVSRSAWIGDYLDANSFLDMWMTGNENNRTGWGNERYDELIRAAAAEPDVAARQRLFDEAETILMEELPVLPIYDYTSRNLANPRLGGFAGNALDEHFTKFWYWMDDAELAEKRAQQPSDWVRVPARGPSAGKYPPAGRDAVIRCTLPGVDR
ncbi:MAG: peptide ABC transporter substrate-binding protein [Planctomycetes bacterium]|nr:peptide ABC transporter substrate-binding protein [Planctomycetota bacterium]MCB9905579.1 peptide ABC transporter substrate-binding protein [Planctomycetota bacterium]